MRHIILTTLACIMAVWTFPTQSTAVQQWNITGSDNWFVASHWTPFGVPNTAEQAQINNGGEAVAVSGATVSVLGIGVGKNGGTGTLTVNTSRIEVNESLDIGDIEGTFATGAITVTSLGTANIVDVPSVQIGLGGMGDINAGQTSASNGAEAHGTGTVNIQNVNDVHVSGDFDLGQTSGSGLSTGMGTGTIRVLNHLIVDGDFDVGQTSGMGGGINSGTGHLTVLNVDTFEIGRDFDVGQTTGDGQSFGTGIVEIARQGLSGRIAMDIGENLDIAKVRALNSGDNTGHGVVSLNDVDLSVGNLEIARVITSQAARGRATGSMTVDESDVVVSGDLIVGELSLGGTNAGSTADGTLNIIDSKLVTVDATVAARLDGTAGTVSGRVEMHRSLLVAQGIVNLNSGSTLELAIDGTSRALGLGLAADYSAIDAETVVLGGTLSVVANPAYLGPLLRGDTHLFELITSLLGISGDFENVTYQREAISSESTYVGLTEGGADGLFAKVVQTSTQVLMENYLALSGDANGDKVVDGQDFIIWNSNKFSSGTDWTTGDFTGDGVTDGQDFIVWNANKFTSVPDAAVPEPSLVPIYGIAMCILGLRSRRVLRSK
jgi:hypothetical protein